MVRLAMSSPRPVQRSEQSSRDPRKVEMLLDDQYDHIQQHFSVLAPELPSLERRNWLIHLHYVRKEFEVRLQNLHLCFNA